MLSNQKFIYLLLILMLHSAVQLSAQEPGTWRANTSFNSITDITATGNSIIWASTTGGLMSVADGEVKGTFTTVDGMHRLSPDVIEFDSENNRLFLGYVDGMIDILDIDTGAFTRLEDIFRASSFSTRSINQMKVRDQQLFVATSFGIVVFDLNTLFVEDTFSKLGEFDRAININAITFVNGNLWAATQQGVAVGSLDSNLATEGSWNNFDGSSGFVDLPVRAIESLGGRIFASTDDRNFEFNGLDWSESTLFTGTNVIKFKKSTSSENVIGIQERRLILVDETFEREIRTVNTSRLTSGFLIDEGSSVQLIAGSAIDGLGFSIDTDAGFRFITPEGPSVNLIDGMTFDENTLISGTSRFSDRDATIDNTKGYLIRRDGEWNTFNINDNRTLAENRFDLVFTTAVTDSFYYFGSWGRGIARHEIETNDIKIFNNNNSTLEGWVADDPTFPVISGMQTDSEGRVWAVSRFGSTPLYNQLPGDEEWTNFSPLSGLLASDLYVGLFIDSRNWKWISLQTNRRIGQGMVVIDTGNPEDGSDQRGVKLIDDFNQGNLPNNQVTAVIEDLNGEVWVGTERGIAKFVIPQFILDGSPNDIRAQWLINADTTAASPFLLRDIQVTAMAVNGANQKWIGTSNEGIFLLNEQGNRILNQFTTENSPLLSNDIQSLAVNPENGELFISTSVGLISFLDVPRIAETSMDKLKVFPNPFVYDRHDRIFIEGMTQETKVRILAANGSLVKTIEARGGRIEWNARNFEGKRVGSGVYLVVALDDNNSERGVGKVVIIR
jgi:hypothetical protein